MSAVTKRAYEQLRLTVAQVPLGWFDTCDRHRGECDLDNLRRRPGDDLALWTAVPTDGSAIH